ncbi:BamA/TamA family outer membrane protein [uncultured Cyclobacterium sp.]|uniref:BamA/TamA family outer membrane protein n=1 Tax=uncultured Cyclobacterium sp. TaxID=453820 RepID=UPI0030EF3843|tara:strand:+ start:25495 stop:29133 length:3639 start_codon:yes stop_codon:yes gene_type:complete
MNKIVCLLILNLLSPLLIAQEAPTTFRLYLVGDAGEVEKGAHPVVEDIRKKLLADPHTPAHIIYLGDNIYPQGMPPTDDEERVEAEYILKTQLDIYKNLNGHVWMIPGNHDWKKGKADGWNSILRAEKYVINHYPEEKVSWIPSSGCPGPEVVALNEETILLLLDSQWWLHFNDKPGLTSDCEYKSEEEVLEAVRYVLEENNYKVILVAMHHPLRSYGPHNGAYSWKDHLFPLTALSPNLYFPLPIIGSIYPLYRTWFGNIQDLVHPKYEAMIDALDGLFKSHPNLVQVAGHEHGLAFTKEEKVNYIISGAGAKHTTIKKNNTADFIYPLQGYAILDFDKNHEVNLSFHDPLKDSSLYDTQLIAPYANNDSTLAFFDRKLPEEVTKPISTQYLHGSWYYKFLGENYRETWAVPATFETIDLATEKGGLSIVKKGGGMQTRSLRLESNNGREYVLRSVNKYPENALSASMRETIAKEVIQDQISSSNPYGALAVARLADQVGIVHTNPKIVHLPDDPILGIYREDYGDKLYLFEEREIAWEGAPDDIKFYSTDKMLKKIHGDNDDQVKQKEVLKARIFDLWIGDWDRHDDQWRWIGENKEKGRDYSPMPRDRDQAFFVNEGIIPKIGSRKWLIPKFQGFDYSAPRTVEGFMFNGRYFDRSFMNELDKKDWEKTLDKMISKMTAESIEEALQDWPDVVVATEGKEIQGKLRKRKTWLKEEMIKYYQFLAKEVDVPGTDKNEFFKVDYLPEGRVQVTLRKIDKSGEIEQKLYQRIFLPEETNEVRLYGMEGDDVFEFVGDGSGEIKIRVIPGDGEKVIKDEGNTRKKNTLIYQKPSEKEVVRLGESTRAKTSSSQITYNRKEFKYDKLMPLATIAYNRDDGIYIGAGVMWEKQGFKKEPFSIRQSLMGKFALKTNAFNIEYEGQAVDVLPNLDLVWEADVRAPQYSFNYFGSGNESVYDTDAQEIAYYRARFNWYELKTGLQSKLGESGSLTFGPQFQAFKFDPSDNSNKFITSQESGLDQNDLDQTKLYSGISAKVVFDTRDQKHMPTRGVYFEGQTEKMWGTNDYANNYGKLNAELAMYWSFRHPSRLVWASKFGAGKNWGDYEFFQGQTLGGINNLRGFRRFRFNGDAVAYNNTEVRVRLFNLKTYVLPATVGLLVYNDIGRIWVKNEQSNKWHNATGGGVWLAPLNQLVATFSVGFNEEEILPFFSFGYQF